MDSFDNDDFFGTNDVDNEISMEERTIIKNNKKLYNEGYITGKTSEESKEMQAGFDIGFKLGMLLGKLCGKLYSTYKLNLTKFSVDIDNKIQILLFENVKYTDNTSNFLYIDQLVELCVQMNKSDLGQEFTALKDIIRT